LHSPRTAAEEVQRVHHAPIELGLMLRERELEVDQAAKAERRHQHRNLARGVAHGDTATFAPIDLHRLGRFVMDFLINPARRRPDLPQVSAQDDHAAGITVRRFRDLLVNADRGEGWITGEQRVDLGSERIDKARARRTLPTRRLVETQSSGHRVPRAVDLQGDGAAAEFFDLVQAAYLRPDRDLHGNLRGSSETEEGEAVSRNSSPSRRSP
jgi:hypothetical protein